MGPKRAWVQSEIEAYLNNLISNPACAFGTLPTLRIELDSMQSA